MVDILITCSLCGKEFVVTVPFDQYMNWQNGALIQDAMPAVSRMDRESLISGFCSDCQKKFF